MPSATPIQSFPRTPQSESELLKRAYALAGHTLGEVAARHGMAIPEDLRRNKGWIGDLMERALGAIAGPRAKPDFPHLGIELKTIPVNHLGRPFESTYVCVAPLDGSMAKTWADSWVKEKLAQVLWVPIVGERKSRVRDRLIGGPFLWIPSDDDAKRLQEDWELITDLITAGQLDGISAKHGQILQLRPKAANNKEMVWVLDGEGNWVQANPRGFYLRRAFTLELVARHLRL